MFDPSVSDPNELPTVEGIYFVVSRSVASLPIEMRDLEYRAIYNKPVLYIGIASNLKRRDFKNHFNGTARNSTLRKSIGSMFNLRREQYPNEVGTGKYKFISKDEEMLSLWMKDNLVLYYLVAEDSKEKEIDLINEYHPPLNIDKNKSEINKNFRILLKNKRRFT